MTTTVKDETFFGFSAAKQWEYENGYNLTSHVTRLAKTLAHFELYKSITHLPGHIVECGVFKGASFIRFATFREILENPYSRKLIGFDAFGRFPRAAGQDKLDVACIDCFEGEAGDGIPSDELRKVFKHKGFGNYELVQGDVLETVPQYVTDHQELKIALLHVDIDLYKPTALILEQFYDRVVGGGVIVLDDYGTVAGETRAVDEFLAGKHVRIEKLPISHNIPAFIRKPV